MWSEEQATPRKKTDIDNVDYLIQAIFGVLKGYYLPILAIILVSKKPFDYWHNIWLC